MERTGSSYEDAFAKAQRLGYAEAESDEDVTGADAAAKIAILARLAFGVPVHIDDVPHEGIERITGEDIAYAKELGLSLKLIGSAERVDGGSPCRVPGLSLWRASARRGQRLVQRGHRGVARDHRDHPVGPGRGRQPDRLGGARRRDLGHDPAPFNPPPAERVPLVTDRESAFYLHVEVADRPGVLAQVAEILGLQGGRSSRWCRRGSGRTRGCRS